MDAPLRLGYPPPARRRVNRLLAACPRYRPQRVIIRSVTSAVPSALPSATSRSSPPTPPSTARPTCSRTSSTSCSSRSTPRSSRRWTTGTSRSSSRSGRSPRSSSASGSTPGSSASTTRWRRAEAQRRLAGTVSALRGRRRRSFSSLVVLAGTEPLTRAVLGDEAPLARAGWCWWRRTSSWARSPSSRSRLLRIQDRPGLFSTFSAVRHTVNTGLKVLLVTRGLGRGGHPLERPPGHDRLRPRPVPRPLPPCPARLRPRRPARGARLRPAQGPARIPGAGPERLRPQDPGPVRARAPRSGSTRWATRSGTAVKFALSAFEPAWGPFVYAAGQARRGEGDAGPRRHLCLRRLRLGGAGRGRAGQGAARPHDAGQSGVPRRRAGDPAGRARLSAPRRRSC